MARRRHVIHAVLLLAACGSSTATTTTPTATASASEPAPAPPAQAAVISTCVADPSFTFSLSWPTALRAEPLQLHTCAFAPTDATGELLPWIVTVDVRDRGGGTPEPLDVDGAVIAEQGQLDVLGTRVPWVAIDDETPWTGSGRMTLASVSLHEHDLILGVVVADGSQPGLGAALREALRTLTMVTAQRVDALLLDPSRVACVSESGGPALTLVIPPDARGEPSMVGACAVYGGDDDFESAPWWLSVQTVGRTEEGADALTIEPDGALRYLAAGGALPSPIDQGTVRWLDTDATWYAVERTSDGVPRIAFASRVVRNGTTILAVGVLAPSERARIPALLAALAGVRVVD